MLDLDGTGRYTIATGIGFLDHMIEQLSRHSLIDIELSMAGDLHIDQHHHSTEDAALALGEALSKALGERRGIARYGTAYAPMDETLSRAAIDISGRPFLVWRSAFSQPRLGEMDAELFEHFFHSLAQSAGLTLHIETLYGRNNHHIVESIFKACGARAASGGRDRSAQGRCDALDQGHARRHRRGRGRRGAAAAVAERLVLVDYGAGNLRSVENALRAAGAAEVTVSADPQAVRGRPHRAARRRRVRRLHGRAVCDPRHGRGAGRARARATRGRSSASASACS